MRTFRRHLVGAPEGVQAFLQLPGATGCQTKMLLGKACHAPDNLSAGDEDIAIARLRSHVAFIGLAERRLETICLWHAQFGSPLWPMEVAAAVAPLRWHNESLISKDFVDRSDELLYSAAEQQFDGKLRERAEAIRSCKQSILRKRGHSPRLTLKIGPSQDVGVAFPEMKRTQRRLRGVL